MKGFVIAILVCALGIAHGQTPTDKKPDMGPISGATSTGIITYAQTIKTYQTMIYSRPKDRKILMEFSDDNGKLVFTVFTDGTVKAESGADLDKTTREFWKNMADAFKEWKASSCSTENR
jgi:hypothetical protein